MSRGYFGVALHNPKFEVNVGSLLRTAYLLEADFFSTIGSRYKEQASDTLKSTRHIPLFEHDSFEHFYENLPKGCQLVGVEMDDAADLLENFKHPQRAVYLFGSEDNGLPRKVLNKCHSVIKLRGKHSMNLACAGSIVLYHRGFQ